ncbi:MAG: family 10 glycosylhydrolase [Bacteroidales bacterium]|nr:family 10 glycosylhydrolase [Bacteroidales bacterium]
MKHIFFLIIFLITALEFHAETPKKEIRAVWLASNHSLDWPSKPYRNSNDINDQQDELIDILDKLKEANFNMVFIQTRIRGDVIYNSAIEPVSPYVQRVKNTWSKYDPLAFAIAECHKRGLECHAWFVTYPLGPERLNGRTNNSPAIRKNKDVVRKHKGEYYLDPGDPKTNNYLMALVGEIVDKYDIDGIHMDYIRYPEKAENFPDNATYKRYGNGKSKAEWRRENINTFVSNVYDMVKRKKPWVQVSSSVVGMYNRLPNSTRNHWTALNSVYQDPEKWLKDGKHDFVVPMMYYADELFFPFVEDWKSRSNGRFIIPGLGVYQVDEKEGNWNPVKIKEQIQFCRENQMEGNAFYRSRFLTDNKKGILDEIKTNFYDHPALLPTMAWLDTIRPIYPVNLKAVKAGMYMSLSWDETLQPQNKEVFFNVYRSKTWPIDAYKAENLVAARIKGNMLFVPIDDTIESGYYYAVTSYDRFHNESKISSPVFFVTGSFEK